MRVAFRKIRPPNRGTLQNQLIRTNHSRRACLVTPPVGNSSPTLRPPCLCGLCVEFSFAASLFIATFAPESRLVAQGATPFDGPEAFSCRISARDLRPFVAQVSAPTLFPPRDLRLLSPKAHTSRHSQLPQNPHLHKNRGVGCALSTGFSAALRIPNVGRQPEIAFTDGTS